MKDGVRKHIELTTKQTITNHHLKLNQIQKEDYINTFLTLREIGYDLESELSIHEQFCMKYGLEPKKKYEHDDKNYYTLEDLVEFL